MGCRKSLSPETKLSRLPPPRQPGFFLLGYVSGSDFRSTSSPALLRNRQKASSLTGCARAIPGPRASAARLVRTQTYHRAALPLLAKYKSFHRKGLVACQVDQCSVVSGVSDRGLRNEGLCGGSSAARDGRCAACQGRRFLAVPRQSPSFRRPAIRAPIQQSSESATSASSS